MHSKLYGRIGDLIVGGSIVLCTPHPPAIFDFGPSLWGQRPNIDRFNPMLTLLLDLPSFGSQNRGTDNHA